METRNYASHPHPVLSQLKNNTSFWIGHMNVGPAEYLGGQTFQCPSDGELDCIEVYSAAVQSPGKVIMTVHAFDNETKNWGPVLSSSEVEVDSNNSESWIRFKLNPVSLFRNSNYGFRLQSHDALMALGEAAWPSKSPFVHGEEWTSTEGENSGHFYRYFSLAFKVALRA